jgi:O-succinylbenzoate synthase
VSAGTDVSTAFNSIPTTFAARRGGLSTKDRANCCTAPSASSRETGALTVIAHMMPPQVCPMSSDPSLAPLRAAGLSSSVLDYRARAVGKNECSVDGALVIVCNRGDRSGSIEAMTPPLDDLLDGLRVVALPMRVRFRGIDVRELALIEGPYGWGEFGAFLEYEPPEAAHWLASAIEAAYDEAPIPVRDRIPINATVPAVDAARVPDVLARFPGARTAKVKVAEAGQTLADDVARVNAVRALVPTVRVDANGGWTVTEAIAAVAALTADGALEYVEQPCATVPELAEVRAKVDVPVAADESIRKADDPLAVVRARAADVAVVKVAPLGGVKPLLAIAGLLDIPIVVSSALDSAVGMSRGLLAAACLPALRHACGLGTGGLFVDDVAEPLVPVDGYLPVAAVVPDAARLDALAATAERRQWWIERVAACYDFLG